MKGLISIINPIGVVFNDWVEVKPGLDVEMEIKGVEGGLPLKVNTWFPNLVGGFSIFIESYGVDFCFGKVALQKGSQTGVTKVIGRKGGKFTPWTCHFRKTED